MISFGWKTQDRAKAASLSAVAVSGIEVFTSHIHTVTRSQVQLEIAAPLILKLFAATIIL